MPSRLASAFAAMAIALASGGCADRDGESHARPNVLWIIADDMGLEVGAYGDPLARTPNLDRLAGEGARHTHAFSIAGVCAPSRATLMTGLFATSIGAHHMRSLDEGYQPVPPPDVRTFTEHLRAAGYYTSSVGKLDYQFSGVADGAPRTNWDDPDGDWRGRAPGQPFFAHVSILDTHETFLFGDRPTETDPAAVRVPPYLPDTPAVRADIARHYDNVARLDAKVGDLLAKLEEDGVAGETVVFFFADNGRALPREKRWVYDGGVHLPLVVRWPGRIEPGTVSDELVSWVDLAPTTLALAGVERPSHMQGRAFLGAPRDREVEPEFVFAAADRHDEARDRIRAVRDRRYKYVRNHQPDVPYGQAIAFRDRLATMQEIFRLHAAGALAPPADWYYRQTKPDEELYDTVADPFELVNLAAEPAQRTRLERMRAALEQWVAETEDLGAVVEEELAVRFWPNGVQPVTPPPRIEPGGGILAAGASGGAEVRLRTDVAGASIAYRMDDGDGGLMGDGGDDGDGDATDSRWKLYTAPIRIPPGASTSVTLRARAVRYGWAESAEAVAVFTLTR